MKDWLALAVTLVTFLNAIIGLQTARINRKLAQEKANKEKAAPESPESGK